MKDYRLSVEQINNMKHCIGWQRSNEPKNRKNKRPLLNAYRNYFTTGKSGNPSLDELVELGLMAKSEMQDRGFLYQVTEAGFEYIKELFQIEIQTND